MTISKAAHERLSADCDGLRAALTERTKQRDDLHATIASLTMESEEAHAEARRQIGRANDLLSRSNSERADANNRIEILKRTIADLERDLADARGYARALNERIEHDSPLVEMPHTIKRSALPSAEPVRYRSPTDYGAFTGDTACTKSKHWTAV